MAWRSNRPVWRTMVTPCHTQTVANAADDQAEAVAEQSDDRPEAARTPDNATPLVTVKPPTRRSQWSPLEPLDDASAELRAAQRRAARIRFRAYCLACGRSSESATAPARPGRCQQCGGTILVERAMD